MIEYVPFGFKSWHAYSSKTTEKAARDLIHAIKSGDSSLCKSSFRIIRATTTFEVIP